MGPTSELEHLATRLPREPIATSQRRGGMSRAKILIVEDDEGMRDLLRVALTRCGYDVTLTASVAHAERSAEAEQPSVILLDLDLVRANGMRLLAALRENKACRIIALSNSRAEFVAVQALDQGASDFVAKPFGVDSLLARVRVALRGALGWKSERPTQSFLEVGPWHIDFETYTAWLGREPVHLTPTEYKLLAALVARRGSAVSHRELLRAVWGPESSEQVEYLRIYMRQLRQKLEAEPSHPRYLLTVPRIGYRLCAQAR